MPSSSSAGLPLRSDHGTFSTADSSQESLHLNHAQIDSEVPSTVASSVDSNQGDDDVEEEGEGEGNARRNGSANNDGENQSDYSFSGSSSSASGDSSSSASENTPNDPYTGVAKGRRRRRSTSQVNSDNRRSTTLSSTANGTAEIYEPPFFHRSNSSFLHDFAPPFYNRPPTPLPPSPSLTSLLRPTFSAAPSRPTTPDSSEADAAAAGVGAGAGTGAGGGASKENDSTEARVAKSARRATTVPRASPKVPTYEYYGFVLYLTSSLSFLMYLLWSYLPSPFLHQLGINYYPNRWWSLAIPAYLVMTLVYIYVALAAYNTGTLTLPLTSIENLVDEAANIAVVDSKGRVRGMTEWKGGNGLEDVSMSKKSAGKTGSMGMLAGSAAAMLAGGGGGGGGGGGMSNGLRGRKFDRGWVEAWSQGTDAVLDIPISGVCEILYGDD
ncbi:hypothetical protein MMC25_000789 [Agyrium rufum]|nr:hypothetical protein [Agyrium rufum]